MKEDKDDQQKQTHHTHQQETHLQKKRFSFSKEILKEVYLITKKPLLFVFFVFLALLILIPILTYIVFIQDISNKDRILNRNNSGLTLLDDTGEPFFSFNQPKAITYTTLDTIPPTMQHAAIASEDRDFYTHPGFSLKGIARAIKENFESRNIVQGGSTITQELVKNVLLTSEKSFLRKYQEVILSIELSRRYSKNEILEMYLNSVYFGEGAFGIENASEAYFGIGAKDLNLAQSALLTGLLPAPSALSPLSNDPTRAKKRQELVLNAMVEADYITQTQADTAKAEEIIYSPTKKEAINILAPHFALMVKDELIKKYGEEQVIRSGYKVKTTLKRTWQIYAEKTVKTRVGYLSGNKVSNGAAVVMDPATGEIKALVGSMDWNDETFGKVNMAVSPRQPGSSFKPLIYADALQLELITPATILEDKKLIFTDGYEPQNYDKRFRGSVTVRRALANSLNIPAIEVMEKVGVNEGIDFAKKLGITTLKDPSQYGLALVLGTAEVPLFELTGAYATFANNGKFHTPTIILEIQDKYNKNVYTYTPTPKQVMQENTAFLISSMLSDNSARSETFGGLLTISRPAAVKTGTTEDYIDSLTIGYTPNLAVGVWVGNNDHTPMDRIAGSTGAAPIWRDLMNTFLASLPNVTFERPNTVDQIAVCPYKNTTTNFATSSAYMEYFIPGTAPQRGCETPTPQPSDTPTLEPSSTPEPTNQPTLSPTNTPTPSPIQVEASPTPTTPVIQITVSQSTPIPI